MARPRAGGNLEAIRASLRQAQEAQARPPVPGRVKLPAQGRQSKRSPVETHALEAAFRKNFRRQIQDPVRDEDFRWIEPTATTNPGRPRTLLAGYNSKARELRIVFRNGTGYSYYGVEPAIWQRFRRSASPGKFINRILNLYPYEVGDWEAP